VPEASKPQRDVPKAKMGMKSKRKYRLLGLAPTPGVYEGFDEKGRETFDCAKCGKVCKVKDFCVACAAVGASTAMKE